MKTVGIIGGLGPGTTAEFYLDIIYSCQKKSRTRRPGIIISSVPLPYNIEEDLITKNKGAKRYLPFLTAEAKRLERVGADFIVMPCNTLHMFIEKIRQAVSIPVLSIVEETVNFFKLNSYKKVGIIATSATIQNNLYKDAFKKEGIEYLAPDVYQQAKMGKIILNLVTGLQKNRDREELISIINSFERKKVDCIALACTDLQLLIPKHHKLKIFGTLKILADATVRKILA